jgi:Bacterial Ig domain
MSRTKATLQVQRQIRSLCLLAVLISFFGFSSFPAIAQSNQTSPLGINLNGVTYYSPQQPFLDIFKTSGGWVTQTTSTYDTGEESKLALDANGWPTSVTAGSGGQSVTYTQVAVLFLYNLPAPYYPSGQYIVLYDGEGTIVYTLDAVKDTRASTRGRDVLNVSGNGNGIGMVITATDPNKTGNYLRNIRLVRAVYESSLGSGEIFNPQFINRIAQFKTLRFMDWMSTNNSAQSAWSDRPTPSNAFWSAVPAGGSIRAVGTPVEVMVALGNKVGADIWVNMPHLATDDYVTQFATYVVNNLGSSQNIYVEYSNETWNFMFGHATYLVNQGKATWPSAGVSDFEYNRSYFGMRTAQICDIWKKVWGANANRVVCVMASQAASTYAATQSLACPLWSGAPCSAHGINAIAIAPYFGYDVPSTWTTQPDGGLSSLFTEIMQGGVAPGGYPGGMIKQALDWVAAYKSVATSYGFDLVAYEAGQSLVNPNDAALTSLYTAANRDSRMGTAYTTYLQGWKNAGGKLLHHFVDAARYTKWGSWGALENIAQTSSPKYDALTSFIAANPCWWSSCSSQTTGNNPRTTGNTPTVNISSPADGTKLNSNGTINIAASASDASGIASITIKGDSTTLNKCTNTTSCSAQWQGKNITKGTHTISATAINNAGTTGSASVTILSTK